LEYIDLYLIHDPSGGKEVRAKMWEGCCLVKDKGKAKSIGVSFVQIPLNRCVSRRLKGFCPSSNFGKKHLEDLLSTSPKYVPAVNQIDLHPFMARVELVEYCKSKDIVLEAWAPLVRGERFSHPVVVELAKKYGKSPAQILIRYGLDRVSKGLGVISFHSLNIIGINLHRVSSLFRNQLVKIVSPTTQTFSTLFSRRKMLM